MLCSQRVVVTYNFPDFRWYLCRGEDEKRNRTNNTAHLWAVFVKSKKVMRESGQGQTVLCNIQDVGVDVNVINPAGVNLEYFFELLLCGRKI